MKTPSFITSNFRHSVAGFVFGLLLCSSAFADDEVKPTAGKIPAANSKPELSLDTTSFHSPSGDEWDLGVKWDLKWDQRWDWSYFEFASSGAWAIDKEYLNQTPILAQGRLGGYLTLLKPEHLSAPSPTGPIFAKGELKLGAQPRSEIGLLWGVNGRYETDQPGDHSNGVFAGFAGVGNTNSRNIYALIPSLYVSVDGVLPDTNTTAEAMGDEGDMYGRFYVAADWLIGLDLTASDTLLDPVSLHASLEYSKSFETPAAISATGQDESFGALFEVLYKIDTGFRANNKHELPAWLFVQYSTGNFAPLPESENRLLAGFRWKF